MGKYTVYPGVFPCHTCRADVKSVRVYPLEKLITWMCPEKHLNEVSLETKKKKKDYEREKRE
jgi:hypothetical protein